MERVSFCLFWGFIFALQMVLIVRNIFEFKKSKKTEILKALICVFILYVILLLCNTSDNYYMKTIVSSVIEMGILFFLLFAFTKSRNLMVDAMIYTATIWACNMVWYIFCIVNPEYMNVGMFDYRLETVSVRLQVVGGVVLLILTYIVILLYKKLVDGRLEILYTNKIFVAIFPIIHIINEVRYMLRLKFAENYMLPILFFTIVFWSAAIIFMMYLYNVLEKRRIMKENKEAVRILDSIFENYEDMVKENNELKDLKHDLNRQLDFIKELSTSENEGAARQYLLKLVTEHAGSLAIPASGNIDVDTILAMLQRRAAKLSICFEEVIEPYCDIKLDTIELVGLLTVIMDDAFSKCVKGSDEPWIRISIRARGKNTMIKVEYSRRKNHFAVKKFFHSFLASAPNAIKNDFLLKRLSEKYNATYIYEEDEDKNILAVVV